jgi:hypothetical protein
LVSLKVGGPSLTPFLVLLIRLADSQCGRLVLLRLSTE